MSKDHVISVRLSDEEYEYLTTWAKNSGKKLSEIVRDLVIKSKNPFPTTLTWTTPKEGYWVGGQYYSKVYYNFPITTNATTTTTPPIIIDWNPGGGGG